MDKEIFWVMRAMSDEEQPEFEEAEEALGYAYALLAAINWCETEYKLIVEKDEEFDEDLPEMVLNLLYKLAATMDTYKDLKGD